MSLNLPSSADSPGSHSSPDEREGPQDSAPEVETEEECLEKNPLFSGCKLWLQIRKERSENQKKNDQ